jgi:hypothetical protein
MSFYPYFPHFVFDLDSIQYKRSALNAVECVSLVKVGVGRQYSA